MVAHVLVISVVLCFGSHVKPKWSLTFLLLVWSYVLEVTLSLFSTCYSNNDNVHSFISN